MSDEETGERIAKVMARAGVASRRDAEKMILAGRVAVNGLVATSPALDVLPGDRVTLDGKPIDEPQPARLWLYYKPVGLVTSAKDEKGRQTVFDTMPEGMPRVMSVGRLDLTSEGLLLLTNDGELKRRLELPTTGWLRKYRVRVNGRPNEATFDPLRRGVEIEGETFLPMEVTLDKQQGANAWLTVGLREGRNREIRRAMAEVGLTVNRLIRVSYGPFRLNTMKPGDVVEVKQRVLREQLGPGEGEAPKPARKPRAAKGGAGAKAGDAARAGGGAFRPKPLREDRPAGKGGFGKGGFGKGGFGKGGRSDERPARPGGAPKPRPLRGEEMGGDRPFRARAPRADGQDNDRAERDRPFRPRAPRAGGDDVRPPRKPAGDKPFRPRAAGGDDARPARKTSGDRPYKPRREGEGPRPARKTPGDRPYKPRAEGDDSRPPRKTSGDRPFKPRVARDGDDSRPARKDGPKGPPGDRPRGPRPERSGGEDRRSEGPRGPRPSGDDPRGPRHSGKPGGKPDGKPAGKSWGKPEGKPGGKPGPRPGAKPGPKPRGRG